MYKISNRNELFGIEQIACSLKEQVYKFMLFLRLLNIVFAMHCLKYILCGCFIRAAYLSLS